jgi:ferritin-like metal-binding protein YciE
MPEMKNLKDLLKHELEDLYSAEEQIINALPGMIGTASDRLLKNALNDHLKTTKKQLARLDKVKKLLDKEEKEEKGVFEKLFGEGKHKCKAMAGLIEEGNKNMGEDMEPEVKDAAIIASAQRIEHYEISGYGTAKAFAMHLGYRQVATLLDETLQEEYDADDLLTQLAIGKVNIQAGGEEMRSVKKIPAKKKSTAKKSSRTTKRTTKRTARK